LAGGAGLAITTADKDLPRGKVGADYSGQLTASGASGAVTWSVSTGALPDGLQLTPGDGTINGKPTKADSFTFTAQVRDHSNKPVTKQFTIVVENGTAGGPKQDGS
jgi:hypothetical protein